MMASAKRYSPPKAMPMDGFRMALMLSVGDRMKW
jgi:hypothetical protein